jgi:hypothetical protein
VSTVGTETASTGTVLGYRESRRRPQRGQSLKGRDMKRILAVLAITIATACGQPVDVVKAVQVDLVTSGWAPAGSSGGVNKIVPSATVTVKNVSNETLKAVQVNAVFRLVSTNEELGSEFRPVSGPDGMPPAAQTEKVTLKAQRGYTGTDPYDDLLKNSKFVDAKVEVFVKSGSGQWTKVSEYPIARQLTGS